MRLCEEILEIHEKRWKHKRKLGESVLFRKSPEGDTQIIDNVLCFFSNSMSAD